MPLVLKAEPRVAIQLSAAEQRIYDSYRQAFAGIGDINDSKVLRAIEDAINANNPLGAVNAVAWGDFVASLSKTVDALNKEVIKAANESARSLPASVRIAANFTTSDPRAIAFAQQRAGKLIRQVSDESRKAVTETVMEALRMRIDRREMVSRISKVVGLDSRQARALTRFYEKSLADGRAAGLDYDEALVKADRLGDKYKKRLIRQRAVRIARTETVAASNAGRYLSWIEAEAQGLLGSNSVKRWITAMDERTCPICEPLNNKEFPYKANFPSGELMPPVHPNCRCSAVIIPAEVSFIPLEKAVVSKDPIAAMFKHGSHDQSRHNPHKGGGGSTRGSLITQASQYKTFEDFSNAISLQGLRPKVWHIADEGFELNPDYKPTNRLGGTSDESGLFVGDPESWQDYAVGRSTVIEYDVTNLSLTTKPLVDTSADYFSDQSGNQGFFIRPSAFSRLTEVKRMPIAEALRRAKEQQDSMPKSKAEARQIWEESRPVTKHGTHDQSSHNPHKGGRGNSDSSNQTSEYPTKQSNPELAKPLADYVVEYPEDGFSHRGINGGLRQRTDVLYPSRLPTMNPELRGIYLENTLKEREVIKSLDKLVELSPALIEPTTTYRGIGDNFARTLQEKGIGATYNDNGFVSLTLDKQIAGGFPRVPTGNVMEIVLPKGTKAIIPSKFFSSSRIGDTELKREKELILGRGIKFEILSIEDSYMGTGNLFKVGIKK